MPGRFHLGRANDWLLVPGERAGQSETGHPSRGYPSSLARKRSAPNHFLGDGSEEPGTVLFPDDRLDTIICRDRLCLRPCDETSAGETIACLI